MSFKDFLNEQKTNLPSKDIMKMFDKIDDVIIQPNGKSVRVRGEKDGEFADVYVNYSSKEGAEAVYKELGKK